MIQNEQLSAENIKRKDEIKEALQGFLVERFWGSYFFVPKCKKKCKQEVDE